MSGRKSRLDPAGGRLYQAQCRPSRAGRGKKPQHDAGRAHAPDPDCITPGKTAIEALRLMEEGRYRHLPIIDDGKVVEIVSRFDFSGLEQDRLDEEIGLREGI